ncbi:MAG: VOC family protein [Syntrophothermus sp.]
MTSPIYPCLWFDGKAEEAAEFYCSVFKNSILQDKNDLVVMFELAGQQFMALNGGPEFVPNPSVSFYFVGESLEEINEAWEKLQDGGKVLMDIDTYDWSERYGWIQDKYGFSWQLTLGTWTDSSRSVFPVLMFTGEQAGKAEEAMIFYTNVFQDSSILSTHRYTAVDQDVEGTVKFGQFRIGETTFAAMDSSYPHGFEFNEAISFVVECDNQVEIDYFWDMLTDGGEESMCGWLKDRFGVSWQVTPGIFRELMKDHERFQRVIKAFMPMRKMDLETILKA